MLFAAAQFRKLVVTGQLPYEKMGKKHIPLDSTAYKYMFNSCRVPRKNQDAYRTYDPSRCTHTIVARKGHFFSIQLVNSRSGDPLPVSDLEEQICQCIILAETNPSSRAKLGIMTSGNRDDWAEAQDALLRLGGLAMEEALEKLESGAIVLNLDDESPISRQELGDLFWTGGLKSGSNRWFDKSIQIMVANNGKAGAIFEHSMMDGMPLVNFSNYITKMTYSKARQQSARLSPGEFVVEDIFGKVLMQLTQHFEVDEMESNAWIAFEKLVTDHVLHAQSFQGYGSSWIKKMGFPPDAYVQVAMQLATYRLFGEQVGTYEATQVRKFLHGRTEVTRAVSAESEAFVKVMSRQPKHDEEDSAIRENKIQFLGKATNAHARFTSLAANANGVDRHLFGLNMMVQEGEHAPNLFSDPVYQRSKHWRVSTSQLSHPRFNLWGYGEVVPDGVGLAYAILPHSCVFNITALRSTGWTDKLSELLEEALLEMRRLLEASKIAPSSRL